MNILSKVFSIFTLIFGLFFFIIFLGFFQKNFGVESNFRREDGFMFLGLFLLLLSFSVINLVIRKTLLKILLFILALAISIFMFGGPASSWLIKIIY